MFSSVIVTIFSFIAFNSIDKPSRSVSNVVALDVAVDNASFNSLFFSVIVTIFSFIAFNSFNKLIRSLSNLDASEVAVAIAFCCNSSFNDFISTVCFSTIAFLSNVCFSAISLISLVNFSLLSIKLFFSSSNFEIKLVNFSTLSFCSNIFTFNALICSTSSVFSPLHVLNWLLNTIVCPFNVSTSSFNCVISEPCFDSASSAAASNFAFNAVNSYEWDVWNSCICIFIFFSISFISFSAFKRSAFKQVSNFDPVSLCFVFITFSISKRNCAISSACLLAISFAYITRSFCIFSISFIWLSLIFFSLASNSDFKFDVTSKRNVFISVVWFFSISVSFCSNSDCNFLISTFNVSISFSEFSFKKLNWESSFCFISWILNS